MFIIPLPFPYLRTSTVHHNLMFVPNLRPSRCKWSYTEFIDTNKKLQFFGIIVCAQEALVVHIIKGQGPSSMSLDYTKLFQQHIQMKLNDKQKSYMLHSLYKACCMIGCWAAAVLQLACSDQWPQPGPGNFSNQSRSQEPEGGWRGQPPAGPLGARLRSHGSGNSQERGTGGSWHPPLSRLEELKIARLWSSWVFCEMENTCHCHRVMQQTRTEDVEIF